MEELVFQAGARAFGDGQHPTTQLVLAALDTMSTQQFRPRIACDMGCGSGILSLAIAAQLGCAVVAADLLEESVAATLQNAKNNGLDTRIRPVQSDGFHHTAIAAHAPYDLMVMNILAEPLMRLAADAEHHLAPEGVLVVSGLLRWQEAQVSEAYQSLGLECTAALRLGDWVALVLQKP